MNFALQLIKNKYRDKVKPEDFPECQECGACCAYFRILFSPKENQQVIKLGSNIFLMKKDGRGVMNGTDNFNKGRCVALTGEINTFVSCSIYDNRPDVCRQFQRVLPNGYINPRCLQAKENYDKRLEKERSKNTLDIE